MSCSSHCLCPSCRRRKHVQAPGINPFAPRPKARRRVTTKEEDERDRADAAEATIQRVQALLSELQCAPEELLERGYVCTELQKALVSP
jgi:hypothetical protein